MKKLLIMLILAGTLAAYDDCPCYYGRGNWFAQLGGSAIGVGSGTGGGVAVGVGWRYLTFPSGVDISIFFQEGSGGGSNAYSIAYPRLRYLYFVNPRIYIGAGLSFSSARVEDKRFRGLCTEFVAGIDLPADERICSFVELAISQPTIKSASNKTIIGPSIALTFGLGF